MKHVVYILLFFIPSFLLAQQTYIYTNYNLNKVIYNPAFCGLEDFAEAGFNIRNQWSGLDGAPQTQIFTINGPIKNKNMGLGGNVFSDQLGAESRIGLSFNYSYSLKLNDDLNLSATVGLNSTLNKYFIKEISSKTHNFIGDSFYQDKEGFIYVAIPSADVNKVDVDDKIILKKKRGNDISNITEEFKVLDKYTTPPPFLAKNRGSGSHYRVYLDHNT